jgi:hypothetical protein
MIRPSSPLTMLLSRHTRRLVFVLVAVVALAGVVAYMASASGQADGEAAPIFGVKIPPDTATGG